MLHAAEESIREMNARLAALETQAQADRQNIARTRRQMRVTWAVSTLAALVTLTIGWHKDAIAQGYGMTLAQAATRIAALETKTASMTAITDPNTNAATVRFTGVNVQVVSGSGSTAGTVDGTGNLIVGYNELRNSGNLRTGSHNLVVGIYNNYSGVGGAVIGYQNTVSSLYSSVSGGYLNTASGASSSVSGGANNTAGGYYSSLSGGAGNTASGFFSSVSGGFANTAGSITGVNGQYGDYSSVSGGQYVRQFNDYGFSAGGRYTSASPGVGMFHSP